jgi:hypothetical protein
MLGIGGSGLDSVADGRAIGKDNGRAELGRASVKIEGGRAKLGRARVRLESGWRGIEWVILPGNQPT